MKKYLFYIILLIISVTTTFSQTVDIFVHDPIGNYPEIPIVNSSYTNAGFTTVNITQATVDATLTTANYDVAILTEFYSISPNGPLFINNTQRQIVETFVSNGGHVIWIAESYDTYLGGAVAPANTNAITTINNLYSTSLQYGTYFNNGGGGSPNLPRIHPSNGPGALSQSNTILSSGSYATLINTPSINAVYTSDVFDNNNFFNACTHTTVALFPYAPTSAEGSILISTELAVPFTGQDPSGMGNPPIYNTIFDNSIATLHFNLLTGVDMQTINNWHTQAANVNTNCPPEIPSDCDFDITAATFWAKADTGVQNGGSDITSGVADSWVNIVDNPSIPQLGANGTPELIASSTAFNFNPVMDFQNEAFWIDLLDEDDVLDPNEGAMFVVSTKTGLAFDLNTVGGTATAAPCGGNRCNSGFRGNRSEFSNGPTLFNTTANANIANVISLVGDVNANSQWNAINGIDATSTNANTLPSGFTYRLNIGSFPGFNITGQIAEAIAFNRALDTDETARVESYLALKYGVTLVDDYYASDWDGANGLTTWTQGNGYDNNIAGIGRDDCFDLSQIKSRSVNLGTIVTIALTDNGGSFNNPNEFDNNLEFLVWGSNNGATQFDCDDNLPPGYNQIYQREWLAIQTGMVGNTDISFDMDSANLTGTAADYGLLVDTDNDGSYANETPIAGTIIGTELVFAGVDLNNNNTFTLASFDLVCEPLLVCSFNLGNDTTYCNDNNPHILDAGAGFDSYTWQDNSNGQTFNVNGSGVYYCTTTLTDFSNNLIVNGDFESGNTGFTTAYNFSEAGNVVTCPSGNQVWGILGCPSTYSIHTSPSNVHNNFLNCGDHTNGSGNMFIANGSTAASTNAWCQTINVTPNTDYAISAWVMNADGVSNQPSQMAELQFSIDGTVVGNSFSPSVNNCTWTNFSETWNSTSNTSITICIENTNLTPGGAGADFALDDIIFTPICTYTDSITVTVNPYPTPNLGLDLTFCNGEDTLLDATTPNATYEWQDMSSNATFNVNSTGTYWVDVTANNCTSRDSIDITVTPLPTPDLGPDQTLCNGADTTLDITTTNATYEWQDMSSNATLNVNSTGTYWVDVTINNCTARDTIEITIAPMLVNNDTATICQGDSILLPDGTYVSVAGTYTDTIVNMGCNEEIVTTLIVEDIPNVDMPTDTITIVIGETATIDIQNPTTGGNYQWSDNMGGSFNGASINVMPQITTTYDLDALNEQGNCLAENNITVVVIEEIATLLIPNAFSPNGDHLNNIFRVVNYEDFDEIEMRIYNRWGELMHEGFNDTHGWDGTFNGELQLSDVYTYYIKARAKNSDEDVSMTGNVVLLK